MPGDNGKFQVNSDKILAHVGPFLTFLIISTGLVRKIQKHLPYIQYKQSVIPVSYLSFSIP